MPFDQLYYTSCEQGLSGYPGYQFNAATPGVPVEVMREVERITAYEPPPGLAYEGAGARLDDYPVSLCFSPGEAAILARVVFTGADFSNRYGNYFAHALVSSAPDADLGELLPVETWQAPFWASVVAEQAELPPLPGPPARGELDRRRAQAFLEDHPRAAWLPALLTAAGRAVAGGDRPVVLVSPDAEDNACWIAALSYLLPEGLARRMSFTTYHRRPAYCPLHVVGTLPDRDTEWHGGAFQGFAVFDFDGGECGAVDVHPLAELLARAGPVTGETLWRQAAGLAPDAGGGLDEWHGPVAAAAAVAGSRLTAADVEAAVGWFTSLPDGRLPSPVVAEVLEALRPRASGRDDQLRALVEAGRRLGAGAGLDSLETDLVDRELDAVEAGGPPGGPVRIGSPAVRDHARRRCEERLTTASWPLAVALLGWTARAEVPLADAIVAACGERWGTEMLAHAPEPDVGRILAGSPALRRGVAAWLVRRAGEDPDAAQLIYNRTAGGLLRLEEVDAHPSLRELEVVRRAREEPARRMDALVLILRQRPAADLGGLLGRLWPHGGWSAIEANRALAELPPELAASDVVRSWLAEAVLGRQPRPGEAADWPAHLALLRRLAGHPVEARLAEPIREAVACAGRLADAERRASASPAIAERIVREVGETAGRASQPARALLVHHLPDLLVLVEVARLAEVLPACPPEAVAGYVTRVRPRLQGPRPDVGLTADLFVAAHALDVRRHRYGPALLRDPLGATVPRWSRRDRDALQARLDARGVDVMAAFVRWRDRQPPAGLMGRLGRLLSGRGDGPGTAGGR